MWTCAVLLVASIAHVKGERGYEFLHAPSHPINASAVFTSPAFLSQDSPSRESSPNHPKNESAEFLIPSGENTSTLHENESGGSLIPSLSSSPSKEIIPTHPTNESAKSFTPSSSATPAEEITSTHPTNESVGFLTESSSAPSGKSTPTHPEKGSGRFLTSLSNLSQASPPRENTTQSPTSTPTPVARENYHRFHANDSLIGQPVACTHEEKLCFHYNRLYHNSFHCVSAEGRNLGFSSGHLVLGSSCSIRDPCPGYRMAYDGECYPKVVVRDLCGCDAEPTPHLLSGVECRCTPSTLIHVEQPEEEGRCRIPDLRFPSDESHFFRNPFEDLQGFRVEEDGSFTQTSPRFACSAQQAQCFSEGKVWLSEGRGCFPLLEKGPCERQHVVALDPQAAREGRAEATCVHVRGGCPPRHLRMAFDGQCHNELDVRVAVPSNVFRNQFGAFIAVRDVFYVRSELQRHEDENLGAFAHCEINFSVVFLDNKRISGFYIPCADNSHCTRYEAMHNGSKPHMW